VDKDTNNLFDLFLEKSITIPVQTPQPGSKLASRPPKKLKKSTGPKLAKPGAPLKLKHPKPGVSARTAPKVSIPKPAKKTPTTQQSYKTTRLPELPGMKMPSFKDAYQSGKNFLDPRKSPLVKGAKKVLRKPAKLAGKAIQAVDPYGDKGILGKTASGLQKIEDYMKTGSAGKSKDVKGLSGNEQLRAIRNRLNVTFNKEGQRLERAFDQLARDPGTDHFLSKTPDGRYKYYYTPFSSERGGSGVTEKIARSINNLPHLTNFFVDAVVQMINRGYDLEEATKIIAQYHDPRMVDFLRKYVLPY